MAVTAVGRIQTGTAITLKSSGGTYAITTASLANSSSESTGARQSAKIDFGATRGRAWALFCEAEWAATPTAGNALEHWISPSPHATAGTQNAGGASGTDAAYSGYSSNITASLKHCVFVGNHVLTAQATATVQKSFVGIYVPAMRYGSLILWNKGGSAFHSSDTNMLWTFTPIEDTSEPS